MHTTQNYDLALSFFLPWKNCPSSRMASPNLSVTSSSVPIHAGSLLLMRCVPYRWSMNMSAAQSARWRIARPEQQAHNHHYKGLYAAQFNSETPDQLTYRLVGRTHTSYHPQGSAHGKMNNQTTLTSSRIALFPHPPLPSSYYARARTSSAPGALQILGSQMAGLQLQRLARGRLKS